MSFAVQIECSDEQHHVVVDLEQQSVRAPAHPIELMQRYKALYELGGEPLPCCLLAIWWSEKIYPGYLRLEMDTGEPEVSRLLRLKLYAKVYPSVGVYHQTPMVVVPRFKSPLLVGQEGYHIGGKGQIIKKVDAYHNAGGTTVYHKPTQRILVGEDWMIAKHLFMRSSEELLQHDGDPDPLWLETTSDHP